MADEVVVETISFKLINELADPIRASVDYAILGGGDISDNLMAAQFNGYDKKARKMINFAADDTKWSLGLPEVEIGTQFIYDAYYAEETPVVRDLSEFRVYPVVPLRENGVFIDEEINYDRYKETRRILKKISIPLNDLIEGMSGTEEEPNPDVGNLDDVYYIFGTDVYSGTEASAEYMWNLFDALIGMQEIDQTAWEAAPNVTNYFKWSLDQFNAKISYHFCSGHEETDVTLGENGDREYETFWVIGDLQSVSIEDPTTPGEFFDYVYAEHAIVVKKQIAPGVVAVRSMHGPTHLTIVDALGERRHVQRGLDGNFIGLDQNSTDPEEAKKAGSAGFFLPMIHEVVDISNSKNSSLMLYDGATLIMYAAQLIHLAWYQTFWFRAVLTMVSVVLSVVPYVGQGIAVVLQKILFAIASNLIISYVFDLIMTKLGSKLGILLVVAVIIATKGRALGSVLQGMPLATTLMHAVKAIGQVITMYQKQELAEIYEELEDFQDDAKERQEKINEASDLLGDSGLDPLLLTQAIRQQEPDESPADFYTRTIHTGNPGVVSLEAVKEFVGNLLTLPEGTPLNHETEEKLT